MNVAQQFGWRLRQRVRLQGWLGEVPACRITAAGPLAETAVGGPQRVGAAGSFGD
jgi:hypothetical protein